jgi:DNA-binding NtrC family response regulator
MKRGRESCRRVLILLRNYNFFKNGGVCINFAYFGKRDWKSMKKDEEKTERGPSILIVDDDSEFRDLLNDELRDDGYRVVQAVDGVDAASKLGEDIFHLVITDLQMPRTGGLGILTLVKENCPGIPVIVITAFGDWPNLSDVFEFEAFAYFRKPFRMEQLKEAVKKALESREIPS